MVQNKQSVITFHLDRQQLDEGQTSTIEQVFNSLNLITQTTLMKILYIYKLFSVISKQQRNILKRIIESISFIKLLMRS